MDYIISGPHLIPTKDITKGIKHLDLSQPAIKRFWEEEKKKADLPIDTAVGCYIYAIRLGPGIKPWYVGQAKKSFRQETFSDRNWRKYKDHFDENINKGTPLVFFVIRVTPTGRIKRTELDQEEANWVEDYLIRRSLNKNSNLLNKKNTVRFANVTIPGIHNAAAKTSADKDLAKMLGLKKPYGFPK